jgi:hypothetical protein
MPPLLKLRRNFLNVVGDCRALYRHCLTPYAHHSHAGVEAAFLQMFKSWESFQEECTIAFLAGRLRADGGIVACHVSAPDEETARNFLYLGRPYLEWTEADAVMGRWDILFIPPNLLTLAVRPSKPELNQMKILRNAIAHSSPISDRRFHELIIRTLGGRPTISRPAQFLGTAYPTDPTRTLFDRYADVLEVTAAAITG